MFSLICQGIQTTGVYKLKPNVANINETLGVKCVTFDTQTFTFFKIARFFFHVHAITIQCTIVLCLILLSFHCHNKKHCNHCMTFKTCKGA